MSVATRQAEEMVEQAIRKSHCSRTGSEHSCVGICTITPGGIQLACALCGKDDGSEFFAEEEIAVSQIFAAAGISLDCLSGESRYRAFSRYREIVTGLLKRKGLLP